MVMTTSQALQNCLDDHKTFYQNILHQFSNLELRLVNSISWVFMLVTMTAFRCSVCWEGRKDGVREKILEGEKDRRFATWYTFSWVPLHESLRPYVPAGTVSTHDHDDHLFFVPRFTLKAWSGITHMYGGLATTKLSIQHKRSFSHYLSQLCTIIM